MFDALTGIEPNSVVFFVHLSKVVWGVRDKKLYDLLSIFVLWWFALGLDFL